MPEDVKSIRKASSFALFSAAALVISLALFLWSSRARSDQANTSAPVKATLHLETFVLNLSDNDQRSYLRLGIDLALKSEAKRSDEVSPVSQVRDTIIGVLAQSRTDELLTAAGKTKLKADLLQALQQRIPELGVEEVYFTEFLIQR